jgi:hypothetical protein
MEKDINGIPKNAVCTEISLSEYKKQKQQTANAITANA